MRSATLLRDALSGAGCWFDRNAIWLAAAPTMLASVLFLLWPMLDIAAARLFWSPETGFRGLGEPALQVLRNAWLLATRIIVVGLVAIGLAKAIARAGILRAWAARVAGVLPLPDYVFLVATMTAGPGLLVNLFLKEVWGRPRPIQTDLFGGPMAFMPAWVPGGACGSNCSFVSGEASSSFWALALVLVAPKDLRPVLLPVWLALMAVISVNRMAFGGHYLSDVLIAWGLTGVVIAVGKRLILNR